MNDQVDKEKDAVLEGYKLALYDWAHWKNGRQYVGSCGTPYIGALKSAVSKHNKAKDAKELKALLKGGEDYSDVTSSDL